MIYKLPAEKYVPRKRIPDCITRHLPEEAESYLDLMGRLYYYENARSFGAAYLETVRFLSDATRD